MAYATVYCLDTARSVLRTQFLNADPDRLQALAETYLSEFPVVEVWRGSACALRLTKDSRPEGAPPPGREERRRT